MTGQLNLEREAPPMQTSPAAKQPVETPDYEIVLGPRHLASSGLVLTVLLAVLIGVSYSIGKSASGSGSARPAAVEKPAAPANPGAAAAPSALPLTAAPTPASPAASHPANAAPATDVPPNFQPADSSSAPLVQDAEKGKLYLQVGAIDKGLGVVWAEGLRLHGLNAFVSPGPSDKVWRVMIGPLDDHTYQSAKTTLDTLGVQNFGKIQE